ncbi:hypothetical protein [Roseibium aggregatum]|uniref:Tetratricopeptide repeat protein n=1 Tax=Roseibium aggregatum TaxID=187304 RepID=A0A939EIK2_9HYPH|nr:hypothetical protein [Roseibium aggregatum]MBN9672370.1 hypothetical protein [Roseibium aggregatum]
MPQDPPDRTSVEKPDQSSGQRLSDKERFELFERRLADSVRSRVETTLKYRYGAAFAILLSAAAFFGYDFIDRAREELRASLSDLSQDVANAKTDLDAFRDRIDELERELGPLLADFDVLKTEFGGLETTFSKIEQDSQRVQDQLDGFIREQTDIIAINFGNTLDPFDNETAGFYAAIREFAHNQDYTQLEVFATVQLAINRAFNNEVQRARRLFDEAEKKARAISNDEYLNVLMQRARTESDQGLFTEALITLEERAVRSLEGSDDSMKGSVYQAIGNIYQNHLKFAQAIQKYEQAALYYDEAQDFPRLSRILKTVGNIRIRREFPEIYDPDAARTAFEKAVRVAQYTDDRLVLFQSLSAMALLLKDKGLPAEAKGYACRSAEFAVGPPVFGDRNLVIRDFLDGSDTGYEEFCS